MKNETEQKWRCILSTMAVATLLLIEHPPAYSADLYMSLSGRDSGACPSSSPCLTLQYSMSQMAPGDTLYIDDGVYPASGNTIDRYHRPPSGTASAFTVIRAKNIPGVAGVPVNQPLKVHFTGPTTFYDSSGLYGLPVSYVKFWGIRWDGIATASYWNHIYFKQVASMGTMDGNNAAFSISGQYNLLEDCVAFGKGRYKFLFYDVSRELQSNGPGYNLCRRCVARHDWAMKEDTSGNPIATFTSYFNRKTAFLNCIDVDSNLPAYWMNGGGSNLFGSFYQAVDGLEHDMLVQGSIVINNAMGMAYGDQPASTIDTGNVFKDIVGVNVAGGMRLRAGNTVSNLTLINDSPAPFSYRSNQLPLVLTAGFGVAGYDRVTTVSNAVLRNLLGQAFPRAVTASYVDKFATATGGLTASSAIVVDPLLNGLLYPVRIEDGSLLASAGLSGGRLGARVMSRLGVDGSFQGDRDWTTEQGPLWPWPLEDWIQAELRTSDYRGFCAPFVDTLKACPASYVTDAYRGFCAEGQTLTRYIWESLGNKIPPEIYTAADKAVPVVTSFVMPATASSRTVPVTKVTATDDVAVTQYLITETDAAPVATTLGWSTTVPTSFTFAATGIRNAYLWARDAVGNVSAPLKATVNIIPPAAPVNLRGQMVK